MDFVYTHANINSMKTFCAEIAGDRKLPSDQGVVTMTKDNIVAINNHMTKHHAKPSAATAYLLRHEWSCLMCYLGLQLTDQIVNDIEANSDQKLDSLKSYLDEHKSVKEEDAKIFSHARL